MKPSEFERLADTTNLEEPSKLLAWKVLVDGQSPTRVAIDAGISRTCIYGYTNCVKNADSDNEPVRIRKKTYRLTPSETDYIEMEIKALIRGR